MYLTALINKLENPAEARRVNAHLKSMKVKGALLGPALKTINDRSGIQIRQSHWTESTALGMLSVQTTAQAQVRTPDTPEPQVYRFKVIAEFQGTAEGTMLMSLDFKESD